MKNIFKAIRETIKERISDSVPVGAASSLVENVNTKEDGKTTIEVVPGHDCEDHHRNYCCPNNSI